MASNFNFNSPSLAKKAMIFVTVASLVRQRCIVNAFSRTTIGTTQQTNRNSHRIQTSSYFSGPHSHSFLSLPTATTTRLGEQNGENDSSNDEFEPTWTYVPHQAQPKRKPLNPNRRRNFSTASEWIVPAQIPIAEDQLQISFSRASGAGGQNVNKVNTKVELRFHVDTANWIPQEVRQRLKTNEANRISNEGFMTVTSQEHRTQLSNRKDALKKLEDMLRNSWARPKVRKLRKGLTKKAKENRRENKKKVSQKKASRGRISKNDY